MILYSSVICLVLNIILVATVGWETAKKVDFGIGLLLFLLAGILSGFLVSGDRIRANYHTSTKEDRDQQSSWSGKLILLAIPFLLMAVILYWIGSSQ